MPERTRNNSSLSDLATEAENAVGQRNMKKFYEITRTVSGKRSKLTRAVKNKDGRTISTDSEQRVRWAEHFHDILNRPPPLYARHH